MDHQAQRRLRQVAALSASIILTAAASTLASFEEEPEAYHTSILTGHGWVLELLAGHPERIRCELGVSHHVFDELILELQGLGHTNSRHVTLEEQLAIFLYCCVTGLTIRHVGERFQRSNQTISRYFQEMLIIFSSPPFYTTYVCQPIANDPPPHEIQNNPRFWPFFKDAIGALDGSHICCSPPASERASYRNRKGFVSQNCLFGCDFSLKFVYALTGWEGSATDARVYEDARTHDLRIPPGKYYLADAGFPHRDELLVPYRGVRHHLAERGRANQRPQNKQELFNLRHASARNVIERIFGVLKRRFRILLLAPEYNIDIQARIPVALCAIHNFIRTHDGEESVLDAPQDQDHDIVPNANVVAMALEVQEEPGTTAAVRRDQIAQDMWEDYQHALAEQGMQDLDADGYESSGMDNDSESEELGALDDS